MHALAALCSIVLAAGVLPAHATDDKTVTLRVKPVLCVVDRFAMNCDMSFDIHWQSLRAGDYCLSNELQQMPLRCWVSAQLGEHRENLLVSHEFYYWMSEIGGEPRLASVKIELLRLDTRDRRRERRSRHVWDVL
ncbi:MAG: DUF3019 domain-containing protein [Burkholderiales bacterium]